MFIVLPTKKKKKKKILKLNSSKAQLITLNPQISSLGPSPTVDWTQLNMDRIFLSRETRAITQ